jgi:hypothetical protein
VLQSSGQEPARAKEERAKWSLCFDEGTMHATPRWTFTQVDTMSKVGDRA